MPERRSRDIRAAGEIRRVGAAGVSLIQAPRQTAGFYVHDGLPAITLSLLRQGGGRLGLTLGGDKFETFLRPGHFLVSPPNTTLACEHEAPMDLLLCLIPIETVRNVLAEHGQPQREPSFGHLHTNPFRDDLVAALSYRLWQEGIGSNPLGTLFADQAVRTLVLALFRLAGEGGGACDGGARGGLAPWQLRRTTERLRQHLDADVSLQQLATLVDLSPSHFCRAFKQTTGLPPHRWQLARRVEEACRLLTSTHLPLIEIAARVGYEDPSQLARVFRKHIGVSPMRYRRERSA
jgi:AraC family transcriptional regulator